MKKYLLIIAVIQIGISYSQKPISKPVISQSNNQKLNSSTDSIQYAIGSYVAQWIMNSGFQINNANLFAKAMDDVFQNKSRSIPDSFVVPYLDAYQKSTQKERALKQEQQLFASLKDKPGIGMFPTVFVTPSSKQAKGQDLMRKIPSFLI